MQHQQPLIEANNIFLLQGQKTLIDNVSLSLSPAKIVTLIGPNGAGKTTLLSLLLGLQQPSRGHIERKPGLNIGYMPQRLTINPLLPLTVKRFLSLVKGAKITPQQALERTEVAHLIHNNMFHLSGGEVQRVLLARALLKQPELLVLDEPTQGVDVAGQNKLYTLISELRDELHCGVLMVSHDLHLVMASTDHVVCLNQHICCHGHPESVSNHPAYLALFGRHATHVATYSHHHDHAHNLHGDIVSDTQPHTSSREH